jgi:hypothetical protein
MNKIKTVSQYLYYLFIVVFSLTPIVYVWYWLVPDNSLAAIGWNLAGVSVGQLTTADLSLPIRLICLVVSILPMLANLLIWYFLIGLFNAYRQGQIFISKNACLIRNIGLTQLIWQLVNFPYQILMTFAMTSTQAPGHHVITLTMTDHDVANIVSALIIILVAWVMQHAAELQQDQLLTI